MENELTTKGPLSLPAYRPVGRVAHFRLSLPVVFRSVCYAAAVLATLYVAAMAVRLYVRKYYLFVPDYIRWSVAPRAAVGDRPRHVFFLFADHFEPDYDAPLVQRWAARYRELASRHHDSDGRRPQHTWFYPGEQMAPAILQTLRGLAADGLGEVELHFHHQYDTAETLRPKLLDAIEEFQRFGFLKTNRGETRFCFLHGNSSLDNSDGDEMCGVNDEIRLLRELGCVADFTFPAVYEDAQPPFVNDIYAVRDDDGAKSYARRRPLSDLTDGSADLMIFQGPLVLAPSLNWKHLFLDVDDGNIHETVPASPRRVDRWVNASIHVLQRPDWIFVKVFAHGISSDGDIDVTLGPSFDQALSYLERQYADGRRYVLHYVTAREAYNLVRAAMSGATGEPNRYLDATIGRYAANGPRHAADVDAAR